MQITIHRGTDEIGGSCVQVTSGGRSILLDAGAPLGETTSKVDLSALDFTDVLISHPHQDHYGMVEGLDTSKTVYIGALAKELVNVPSKFIDKKKHLDNNFQTIENRKKFNIGPFQITPYLMDHSSYDAYGFLVEAEGRKIYYSGDFRTHGSRGEKIRRWFEDDHPLDVDVLLMEGTMMGRDNSNYETEKDVKSGIVEVLNNNDGPCFMVGSGQHIDRLLMAYQACRDARPQRKFVTDIYTGFILYIVSGAFKGIPSIRNRSDVRVLTSGITYDFHKQAFEKHPEYFAEFMTAMNGTGKTVDFKDVIYNGKEYLLKVTNFKDLLKIASRRRIDCSVVYSQWSGYRKSKYDPKQAKKFKEIEDLVGIDNFHEIHTSGHAVREDLDWFAQLIKPKTLIPIHTEKKEAYIQQFKSLDVTILADGETYQV